MKNILPVLLLIFGCQNTQTSSPEISPAIPFKIVSTETKKIVIKQNVMSNATYYILSGKVKNLSGEVIKDYSLKVEYILYSEDGKSTAVEKPELLLPDEGFEIIKGTLRDKKNWNSDEVISFNITDLIPDDAFNFPIDKVMALYRLEAANPFGYSFDDYIGQSDITDQWKAMQKKLNYSSK